MKQWKNNHIFIGISAILILFASYEKDNSRASYVAINTETAKINNALELSQVL